MRRSFCCRPVNTCATAAGLQPRVPPALPRPLLRCVPHVLATMVRSSITALENKKGRKAVNKIRRSVVSNPAECARLCVEDGSRCVAFAASSKQYHNTLSKAKPAVEDNPGWSFYARRFDSCCTCVTTEADSCNPRCTAAACDLAEQWLPICASVQKQDGTPFDALGCLCNSRCSTQQDCCPDFLANQCNDPPAC